MQDFADLRPVGGFGFIMADPPWSFATRSAKGVTTKGAGGHYATMSLADICAMDVVYLAAPDCLLWLWATNPMLPHALETMSAWGFTFKTAGTWVKLTAHGKVAMGTGYVLRSANEPFLLGTRGKPRTTRSTRSAVSTGDEVDGLFESVTVRARAREHSRKPDAAYRAAEALMPDVSRVELFAREQRPGWSVWGNETTKFSTMGEVT